MRISEFIKRLEDVKNKDGDIMLRNFSFETPSYAQKYHLNSKKNEGKAMSRAEFQKLFGKVKEKDQ